MKAVRQFVVGGGLFFGFLVLVLGFVSPTVVRAAVEKITTVFVTNDAANAIPVSVINTPAPSQFVTLWRTALSNDGLRQQFANGDTADEDYVVPAGMVLVITDIDVVFRRTPAEAATTANFFLTSTEPSVSGTPIRARLMATLDGEGNGRDSQHLQTGIVIASGTALGDNMPDTSFDAVMLRGYLAPEN